jgi:ABC-type phosphate transport system ATPase subunit
VQECRSAGVQELQEFRRAVETPPTQRCVGAIGCGRSTALAFHNEMTDENMVELSRAAYIPQNANKF